MIPENPIFTGLKAWSGKYLTSITWARSNSGHIRGYGTGAGKLACRGVKTIPEAGGCSGGSGVLMHIYEKFLQYGVTVGQVLLTREDLPTGGVFKRQECHARPA